MNVMEQDWSSTCSGLPPLAGHLARAAFLAGCRR